LSGCSIQNGQESLGLVNDVDFTTTTECTTTTSEEFKTETTTTLSSSISSSTSYLFVQCKDNEVNDPGANQCNVCRYTTGGSCIPLYTFLQESYIGPGVLSSDGSWLALGLGNAQEEGSDLYLLNTTRPDIKRMTHTLPMEMPLDWKDDSSELLLAWNTNSDPLASLQFDIASIHEDGKGDRLEFVSAGSYANAAWLPGCTEVVFANDVITPIGIYLFDIQSNVAILLVQTDRPNFLLSPDGRYIAYNAGTHPVVNTFIYDIDTGETVNVSQYPSKDGVVAWDPAGNYLLIRSNRESTTGGLTERLYLWDLNHYSLRPLTETRWTGWPFFLAWDPAGQQILIEVFYQSGESKYWLIDVETGQPELFGYQPQYYKILSASWDVMPDIVDEASFPVAYPWD
jgi:dipeptidyl aminopeptidase/acylaminoacyl peptidase